MSLELEQPNIAEQFEQLIAKEDRLEIREFLDDQKNVKKMPTTNELVVAEPEEKTDGPTVVLLGWTKAAPPKREKDKEPAKKP